MERSAGGRTAGLWLFGADAIGRGRRGLVCEEEKAEPVRAFPGTSGVRCPDSAEGIPERHKTILEKRATYPSMPKGYFDPASARLLTEFRDAVLLDRREERMEGFPEFAVAGSLQKTWCSSATNIYRNWLRYVVSKKMEVSAFPALAVAGTHAPRKRSALL